MGDDMADEEVHILDPDSISRMHSTNQANAETPIS